MNINNIDAVRTTKVTCNNPQTIEESKYKT